jgi:hypothetical protein
MYPIPRGQQIELVGTGQASPFWAALHAFKARAAGAPIAQLLLEPHPALLTRILLGVAAGLPAALALDLSPELWSLHIL